MNTLIGRYLGAFAVSLGYGMLAPLVGKLVEQAESSVLIGLLIGVYPLAKAAGYAACLTRQARMWSERVMLLVTAASYAALGISLAPELIFVARCLEGFVFGWFLAKVSLEIAASGKAVGYRLSWLNGMSSAGVLAGPLLIACANFIGWAQGAFLAVATLCACVALLPQSSAAESEDRREASPSLRNGFETLSRAWTLIAVFALFDFTFGALSLSIPLAFGPLGENAVPATAALFSAGFLIFTVMMPMFGYLADRFHPMPLLIASLATIAMLFAVPGLKPLEPTMLGTVLLVEYVAAAAAYSSALAVLGKLFPKALPLVGIVQSLAMSAGSVIAGYLVVANDTAVTFSFLAVAYFLIAGLFLTTLRCYSGLYRSEKLKQ